jgi:hypothetical protein
LLPLIATVIQNVQLAQGFKGFCQSQHAPVLEFEEHFLLATDFLRLGCAAESLASWFRKFRGKAVASSKVGLPKQENSALVR